MDFNIKKLKKEFNSALKAGKVKHGIARAKWWVNLEVFMAGVAVGGTVVGVTMGLRGYRGLLLIGIIFVIFLIEAKIDGRINQKYYKQVEDLKYDIVDDMFSRLHKETGEGTFDMFARLRYIEEFRIQYERTSGYKFGYYYNKIAYYAIIVTISLLMILFNTNSITSLTITVEVTLTLLQIALQSDSIRNFFDGKPYLYEFVCDKYKEKVLTGRFEIYLEGTRREPRLENHGEVKGHLPLNMAEHNIDHSII